MSKLENTFIHSEQLLKEIKQSTNIPKNIIIKLNNTINIHNNILREVKDII